MANESEFDENTLKVLRAVARNHYPETLYAEATFNYTTMRNDCPIHGSKFITELLSGIMVCLACEEGYVCATCHQGELVSYGIWPCDTALDVVNSIDTTLGFMNSLRNI